MAIKITKMQGCGNDFVILNPGLPDVQKFLVNVCMEVVEKYDIDEIKVFEPSLNDIFVEHTVEVNDKWDNF